MRRTCENCKHFCRSFIEGQYRCFRSTPAVSREWDSPACEHYELAPAVLKFAAEESLAKARKKHPGFVPIPQEWEKLEGLAMYYGEVARVGRRNVAESRWEYQLGDVLLTEAYEFLEAFFAGDFARALEEAGDVIAVLYRALNGEGKEVRHEREIH